MITNSQRYLAKQALNPDEDVKTQFFTVLKAARISLSDIVDEVTTGGELPPTTLTDKEKLVIGAMLSDDNNTYKSIAMKMGMATSTVRTHLHKCYAKCNVVGFIQLAAKSWREGWAITMIRFWEEDRRIANEMEAPKA